MTREELERLQAEVYAKLEQAGLPVKEWEAQLTTQRQADPLSEPRPFEVIQPSQNIRHLKPGFVEYRRHHQFPEIEVTRCQAWSRRNQRQCNSFAVGNGPVCYHHGGAPRSGKLSPEGRANQIKVSTTAGGTETRAIRAERKRLNRLARELTQQAVSAGLRGPTRTKQKPKVNYDD